MNFILFFSFMPLRADIAISYFQAITFFREKPFQSFELWKGWVNEGLRMQSAAN